MCVCNQSRITVNINVHCIGDLIGAVGRGGGGGLNQRICVMGSTVIS